MYLSDSITTLKGVGAKMAANLAKLNIFTIYDLILHFPRDYYAYPDPVGIEDQSYDDTCAMAYDVNIKDNPKLVSKGRMSLVTLELESSGVRAGAVWYHSPFIRNQLHSGDRLILYGRMVKKGRKRILEQPEIFEKDKYIKLTEGLKPVYSLTEGISQNFMRKLTEMVFEHELILSDHMPGEIRKRYRLSEYTYALKQIHYPDDGESLKIARKRLVFDEFFMFALSLKLLKKDNHQLPNDYKMQAGEKIDHFIESLPYHLTGAQMRVFGDIKKDMASEFVMNRLIQGDVGSGKTMIAMLAMYLAYLNGYQSCMMAPTEVLATQHYENFTETFEKLGVRVGLLTGSVTAAKKRKLYAALERGEIDMLIGTQAVFQEKVNYKNLALIITDEQHRFGVRQRELLAKKSLHGQPHVLVMSATPIPRTLAIILYSDLDLSVVDEKPANRLPIKNCVVGTGYRPSAYSFMKKQIGSGHQVYIICPMVEENEETDIENVIDYAKRIRSEFDDSVNISFLHGKMKPSEKNKIMEDFAAGNIHILVSTTVIEVGVDVPNATVMMIENAERFGLAQLHQLRGRVGRGKDQSYCIFMYGQENQKIKERLDIMLHSNDGFKISAEDLKLRGPGDFFGIRQSGSITFKIGDIFDDSELLMMAGEAADHVLLDDPDLSKSEHRFIHQYVVDNLKNRDEQVVL